MKFSLVSDAPAEKVQDTRGETPALKNQDLVLVRSDPLNAETPLSALNRATLTPNRNFYVRNHFSVPILDTSNWRLRISGLVTRSITYTFGDLLRFKPHTMIVTLECAGNGRSFIRPAVEGEQWGFGAVGTAAWTGAFLSEVLDAVGVKPTAQHAVFEGADRGSSNGLADPDRFRRSLSLADIRHSRTLLAYTMNGERLPAQHGHPVRLIVPGWYGVASVKWLTEIDLVAEPFAGHFQTSRYMYELKRRGAVAREPVSLQRVRAIITEPEPSTVVPVGPLTIRGLAWAGDERIERVDVSVNGGAWRPAALVGASRHRAWRRWQIATVINRAGSVRIRARAADESGRTQPARAPWNRLGYGNNSIQELRLRAQ